MEELVDVVDEHDNVVGQTTRKDAQQKGTRHRGVAVMIVNDNGDLLVQKRGMNQKLAPGVFDTSSAGGVSAGESYEEAAVRELKEELGIAIPLIDIAKIQEDHTIYGPKMNSIWHLFLGKHNDKIHFNKEEVADVIFMNQEEIQKKINDNPDQFTFGFKQDFKAYLKWKK